MKNEYLQLKERQQKEVDEFPMMFAFNNKQFKEGMEKLGLTVDDTDKIYKLSGTGGFYKRTDADKLYGMFERHTKEMDDAVSNDKTGEGFIFKMFDYELSNHEFVITMSVEDTLCSLGLTKKEIDKNPALKNGLKKAIASQWEWYHKDN